MENTQAPVLPFTDDTVPAVYKALVDFHVDVAKHLKRAQISASEIARVQRRTKRAVLALGQACAGHRRAHHLDLSDAALVACLGLLHLLRAEDLLAAPAYDEASRQIQRIRAGLQVLSSTPSADWPTAALPPPHAGAGPADSVSTGLFARTEMRAASPRQELPTDPDRSAANDDGPGGTDEVATSARGRPEAA
jgi:hypothetical protein